MNEDLQKALDEIQNTIAEKTKGNETIVKELQEQVTAIKEGLSDTDVAEMKTQLDSVQTELESINAKLEALPTATGDEDKADEDKMLKIEKTVDGKLITRSDMILKVVDSNQAIPGSPVNSVSPYQTMLEANPYRGKATSFVVAGSTFNIPTVGGITFASEASIPANRTQGGTLTSATAVLKKFTSQNSYSLSSLDDVVGLDAVIVSLMSSKAGSAEGADSFAAIKAGSFGTVNTGVAANLPNSGNIVGKLGELVAKLDTAYLPNAQFTMSREAYARLTTSENNGLNFDPSTGTMNLFGYPITVTGFNDAGTTANNESVVFGDFGSGLLIASSGGVNISRYDQTNPGAITYYGEFRTVTSAWDTDALVVLKSGV